MGVFFSFWSSNIRRYLGSISEELSGSQSDSFQRSTSLLGDAVYDYGLKETYILYRASYVTSLLLSVPKC